MIRRSRVWLAVLVIFCLVNFAGGIYAASMGELLHAGVHAALLFLGARLVCGLAPRARAGRSWRQGVAETSVPFPNERTDPLTRLEQSIDAVAIEVERIGEGQRFMTRLFAERGIPQAPGDDAADPIEIRAGEGAPHVARR